jgi:hypothetical protein
LGTKADKEAVEIQNSKTARTGQDHVNEKEKEIERGFLGKNR